MALDEGIAVAALRLAMFETRLHAKRLGSCPALRLKTSKHGRKGEEEAEGGAEGRLQIWSKQV